MSKDEESLVICIRCVRLDLNCALFKKLPILAILQARLHEDAILVSREVLATHDLPNEVDFGLEVSSGALLVARKLLPHSVKLRARLVLEGLVTGATQHLIGLVNCLLLLKRLCVHKTSSTSVLMLHV